MIETPKIDERSYEDLAAEMESLIPAFLPEWKPGEGDVGLALIHIFAHMAQEVVLRLNQVPRKHFAAFLDMMGISLLPAAAARAPLTFYLSQGANTHVLIPRGTAVAAADKEAVFETETNLWATPAKLIKMIVTDSLYLGFDQKMQKGPIGMYFSLAEQESQKKEINKVSWYYSLGQPDPGWGILEVKDYTSGLIESGIVEFFMPPDFDKRSLFGEELYWLEGVWMMKQAAQAVKIKGVHINTVLCSQVETVEEEILGSSDGGANQEFRLRRRPVAAEEIWVDEIRTLTAEEKQKIVKEQGEDAVREKEDETGQAIERQVRWQPVEDFFGSGPKSRHYMIERAVGQVRFGDGICGLIPAIGTNNIRASYRVGGGRRGNVGTGEISDLRTAIPYVDRLANPVPAEGGADTERMAGIFTRGPYWLKHRSRAVTPEDFERIAAEVSSKIVRTRCILTGNRLTIIVIPYGEEEKPIPSAALLKLVKRRLLKYSLNTLSLDRIVVQRPQYVEVSVTVDVFPVSMETAVVLEAGIIERLNEFLHPLYGGPGKKGWDFGRDLHISDVYGLLESIEGVEHTAHLRLNGAEADVKVNGFQTICSGQHRIVVR